MEINYRTLNPLGFHLMKYMQDPTIRQIILYGGSSAGKSYTVAQCFLLFALNGKENTLVMRKVGASIKDSIYEAFKAAADQLGIARHFQFKDGLKVIKCLKTGSRITFKGLDDAEKIKGLESIKRVFMDEWSEYEEADYKQMKLRLRGMEGQQLIFAFNPIKETHWIKKNVFDKEKWHDVPMDVMIGGRKIPSELTEIKSLRMNEPKTMIHKRTGEIIEHPSDMVVLQTTYLNNFWVVGSPNGKYGYYDEQCIATFEHDRIHDPDYYNVYALGEWGVIRTGSEFFGSFNRAHHVIEGAYSPALPVHLSVDNNVLPYITNTFFQVHYDEDQNGDDFVTIKQFDEICAESPNNTVRKAAKLVTTRLKELWVDRVYLHGDASTKAASTIDDEKRSFLDLYIDTLQKEGIEVIDCVGVKNPSVSMSGEFINALFDGSIAGRGLLIDEKCKISIEDYLSVQKDANGAMAKTKIKNKTTMQTYEEHGHCSDTLRYVVCDIFQEEFIRFANRRKRNLYARDGVIHFFNPDTECKYENSVVYVLPNINGCMALVHGKKCGDKWHIVNAVIRETTSAQEIRETILAAGSDVIAVECGAAYYPLVRDLRSVSGNVRLRKEAPDIDKRIAATSDFVKSHLLFNETMANDSAEYGTFMTNLMDYNKDSMHKEASAVVSGFIQFIIKLG